MKKISHKKTATIAVVVLACVLLGFAAFIIFHDDKPVYTPTTNIHEFASGSDFSTIEFKLGPDITGKVYDVKLYNTENDEQLVLTLISIDDGEKQQVLDDDGYSGYLFNAASVIDDNGKAVIAVNMDQMSGDYIFVMYTIEDGELVRCGTDCAMITEAKFDSTFTAGYNVDFFGTWTGLRTLELTSNNKIQLKDGDYLLPDDDARKLTSKADIHAEIADDNGEYKSYKLEKGRTITLYATDGESYVLFTDETGVKGRIKGEINDGFTMIDGKNDVDLFDGIHYAG